MNKGMNFLWPTKVLYDSVEDKDLLNNSVQEIFSIYDLKTPPSDYTNNSFFDKAGPYLNQFRDNVVVPAFDRYLKEAHNTSLSSFKEYKMSFWITGTGNGYNMIYHNHSGAAFSAVFYMLAEEENKGGSIIFSDPRSNANRGYDGSLKSDFSPVGHQPSTGDFLIFPSYLYHYVNPYYSNLRIAMPVDLFLYYD